MKLIPSFGKTIFDSSSDISIDALDACFDELADNLLSDELSQLNPLIQDLPVVRYFISAGKTALAVKEYCFVKKSLRFFSQLRKGSVNKDALEKRRVALENSEKWIYREMELIVSTLDRLDQEAKAKVIAELYRAYLNGELSNNRCLNEYEFHDLCSVTERLFLLDILQIRADFETEQTRKLFEKDPPEAYCVSTRRYDEMLGRLTALGLMTASVKVGTNLRANTEILEYEVSSRGKKYAEILSRVDFLGISDNIFFDAEKKKG